MEEQLLARWCRLVPNGSPAVEVGVDLLRRYAERHRRYHDARHLREVLDAVETLARYAVDVDAVRLAAWFHDAVYTGAPGADEKASAVLAEQSLPRCGVQPDRVAEVGRLVRLTATHDPADDDRDGAVLCDADLAILASSPLRYAEYEGGVREEYGHVSAAAFRSGRQAVLQRLLDRETLYSTPRAQQLWEAAARQNLSDEVRRLGAG